MFLPYVFANVDVIGEDEVVVFVLSSIDVNDNLLHAGRGPNRLCLRVVTRELRAHLRKRLVDGVGQIPQQLIGFRSRKQRAELRPDIDEHWLDVGQDGLRGEGLRLVLGEVPFAQESEGNWGGAFAHFRHIIVDFPLQLQAFLRCL